MLDETTPCQSWPIFWDSVDALACTSTQFMHIHLDAIRLFVERPALAVRLDLSFRSVYFFFSGNILPTAEPISTKVCTVTASGQE